MLLCVCTAFSIVFSINVIEMNTLIKGETVPWALPPGSWDTETTTDYTMSQQFPRQGQSFHKNATGEEGWVGRGAGPKKNSSSVLWSPDYSGAKGLQKWRPMKKTKIMASGPITSWQIDGKTMETVTDFISLCSKITVDSGCIHEIKTLAPWKKSYDKP